MRLTEKKYWENVHRRRGPFSRKNMCSSGKGWFWRLLNYADFLLWEGIFRRNLPPGDGRKALEIGSAPGDNLVKLQRFFGYDPFGIEYTEAGYAANSRNFLENGLDPANVFHGDVFDPRFEEAHAERYDLVASFGFIEHFDSPADVVATHLRLLKPGGHLVIVIPNLSGMNRRLVHFFDADVLPFHNLDIMEEDAFAALFWKFPLKTRFCGYGGTFHFGLFVARTPVKRTLLALCKVIQIPLSLLFLLFFGDKGKDTPRLSPYLVFIGTKGGEADDR